MLETLRDPGRVRRNDAALAWYAFLERARSLLHMRFGSAALLIFATLIAAAVVMKSFNFYLVEINGRMNSFVSLSVDLRQVLSNNGYEVKENDILKGDEQAVKGFAYATLEQCYPVAISHGGEQFLTYSSYGESVLSLLTSAGIQLRALDEVSPSLMSVTTEGMLIEVTERNLENNVIDEEDVLLRQKPQLANQERDAKGATLKTAAHAATSRLKSASKSAVIYTPSASLLPVELEDNVISTGEGEFSYIAKFGGVCTAYCSGTTTATGTKVRVGSVAVDPKVIPLGSKLYIVSADGKSWMYGHAVAEDTGGAVKGNIVDLYMPSYSDCINFGRRKALIYVLE